MIAKQSLFMWGVATYALVCIIGYSLDVAILIIESAKRPAGQPLDVVAVYLSPKAWTLRIFGMSLTLYLTILLIQRYADIKRLSLLAVDPEAYRAKRLVFLRELSPDLPDDCIAPVRARPSSDR